MSQPKRQGGFLEGGRGDFLSGREVLQRQGDDYGRSEEVALGLRAELMFLKEADVPCQRGDFSESVERNCAERVSTRRKKRFGKERRKTGG